MYIHHQNIVGPTTCLEACFQFHAYALTMALCNLVITLFMVVFCPNIELSPNAPSHNILSYAFYKIITYVETTKI